MRYPIIAATTAAVILSAGIVFYVLKPFGAAPGQLIDAIRDWGTNKISVSGTSDRMEVKPIAEMAFSKVKTRVYINYSTKVYGSLKRMIGVQLFEAKYGWDANSNQFFVKSGLSEVLIKATTPKLLSLSPIQTTPEILYREDGVVNKLTPEDMMSMQIQLKNRAAEMPELKDGAATAKESFESFWKAVFISYGKPVRFEYTDHPEG